MATSRNNSGPYILPRRNPKTARPGTFITTRNLSTIQIQPRPTSFLSGPITKSSQPLRVVGRIIDPMTLGSSRQILLAPTSAVLSPAEHFSNLQPQAQAHDDFHRPQARQQRTPMFKLGQEQSEEDELDISEVYRLLDESAGYRAQELGIPRRRERLNNLTPEEKINRRKHKNRIAAQAARDRKKVNTHRLEESLRRALVEIGQLRAEVNLLRGENSRLEAENQTFRFEQERMELDQDNTVIFQRKSKDEQKHYDEHLLAPPRKCQRQFRPQPMLSHQQTVDLKPSFLVRSMERAQEHTQPQQRTDGIGQQDSVGSAAGAGVKQCQPKQRQWKAKRGGEEGVRVGMCGQSAHGAVAGGEDVELQKIFDELFEDFNFPVDVDRFCNEVIEEGIVESNDAFGSVKTGTAQQQQTNCGNGCVPPTDATESQSEGSAQVAHNEQCELGWQQCRVGGGQQQHGIGSRTAIAAALSPHNYFAQPPSPAPSSSICAQPMLTPNSNDPNPSNNDISSPSYQKIPSPCLSSHSTYIDEFASSSVVDDDQRQFVHFHQTDSERDPLFTSVKQEYLEQFDDLSHSFGFDEPTDWTMNNSFDSLGAEESCTLDEGPTTVEDSIRIDEPIAFYVPLSPNHSTFLSY